MQKTITITGIGRATAKPDTVVITMALDSCDRSYDKAMEIAANNIVAINQSLVAVAFEKDALKTTDFDVRTNYENVKDRSGNYHREFKRYIVSHKLKIEFPFDMKRLSDALSSLAGCLAHPQLSISFVVKDTSEINEKVLRSATINAKKKAEILSEAASVKLGKLITINYSWSELNICSDTRYDLTEECLAMPMAAKSIEVEPEDIDVRDTATFVWEIE